MAGRAREIIGNDFLSAACLYGDNRCSGHHRKVGRQKEAGHIWSLGWSMVVPSICF